MSFIHRLGLCLSLSALATAVATAQSSSPAPRALTSDDYARAEKLMIYNTTPLVLHNIARPTWLPWTPGDPSERFWYRTTTEKGAEAVLIDAVKGTRSACDLPACKATERDDAPRPSRYGELSPDGRRRAFVRDWNLWVRDVASGRETPLTKEGV
jgi:dipeptidyl-peptidase-4